MSPLVEHQLCKSNSCRLIILSFTCYNLKYTYIIWLTSAPIEAFACKDGLSIKKKQVKYQIVIKNHYYYYYYVSVNDSYNIIEYLPTSMCCWDTKVNNNATV